MTEARDERRLVRTKDAIAVSLPFAWLAEVWVRGIAVTFGRLCIAVETTDGHSWILHTLGPDLTDLNRITIITR
jgi:hypothetical protein